MAVNITAYSNSNASSRSIAISFEGDVLAGSNTGAITSDIQYYFKFQTSARDLDNNPFPAKVALDFSDLVLNKQKQSRTDTSNAYSNIKDMVVDYTYDFIYGHTQNQYGSGAAEQLPMKFSR